MISKNQTGTRYDKEWISSVLILIFIICQIGIFAFGFFVELKITHLIFAFLLFVFLGLFYSIRVTLDHESLHLKYGVGLYSIQYPLSSVLSSAVVQNTSLHSWVYNPGGGNALQVTIRGNGSKINLPIDDASHLPGLLKQR